jgi:hypothetical protein
MGFDTALAKQPEVAGDFEVLFRAAMASMAAVR